MDAQCYGGLNTSGLIEELVVWHRFEPEKEEYIDYLLNCPLFGCVFLTKSYLEGSEQGFVIDTSQPSNLVIQALIALRTPFEHPWVIKVFSLLRERNYNQHAAFYFGNVFRAYKKGDNNLSCVVSEHGVAINCNVGLKTVVEGTHNILTPSLNTLGVMRLDYGEDFDLKLYTLIIYNMEKLGLYPTSSSICRDWRHHTFIDDDDLIFKDLTRTTIKNEWGDVVITTDTTEENFNLLLNTLIKEEGCEEYLY